MRILWSYCSCIWHYFSCIFVIILVGAAPNCNPIMHGIEVGEVN